MKQNFLKFLFFFSATATATADISHARTLPQPISQFHLILNQTLDPTSNYQWGFSSALSLSTYLDPNVRFLLAGVLSFVAAAISSAGGIGGGGLFIPILSVVAGVDLKIASNYSAFMVTGGSVANVACYMFIKRRRSEPPMIDYDIALLSQPCMLLGVSCGVILNLVLPEWLITVIFSIFLGLCTFKTCKSGIRYWKIESEDERRNGCSEIGNENSSGLEETLLRGEEADEGKLEFLPWMKLGMLVLIWFSFFLLYLLRGNRNGQSIVPIETCGIGYWILSSVQIPLAIIFTTWILCRTEGPRQNTATQQENEDKTRSPLSHKLIFPVMALLAGVLGGVFGIGGGMLISPLLLQVGIKPEVTAATCSLMVLFSSTMSAMQYLLLGMENVNGPLTFAAVCFVASLVGLTLVQQAIVKHGRASLIVFSVGMVMTVSTILMTGFGVLHVWSDYTNGENMGFKKPC